MRFRNNPWFLNFLQGFATSDVKFDAGETAFIAKELEYVQSRVYDIDYAPAKGRQFVPINTEVPPGAETYAYDVWDRVGLAKFIANYADDLPNVEAFRTRLTAKCASIGDAYQYSIQDLAAIAMAGNRGRLDEKRAFQARDAVERLIDRAIAFGESTLGLTGFLNSSAITVIPPATGNWTASTSTDVIFADMNKFVNTTLEMTKYLYQGTRKFTYLMDQASYGLLKRPMGASNPGRTIMATFLDLNQEVEGIYPWYLLDTADANGTGPRHVLYYKDPQFVDFVISQEFEQLPPQNRNLAFVVPCHARVGSVNFYKPNTAAYMDRNIP